MPPIKSGSIRVKGFDEFRREIRKLDDAGLTAELKETNFEVGAKVVRWAQARARSRMERAAARTLKATRAQNRAAVSLGGAKAPFAAGAEFGSIRDIPRRTRRGEVHGWNQFKAWRGNGPDAGYFLFPSIRANEEQILETYNEGVEKLTRKAFPD